MKTFSYLVFILFVLGSCKTSFRISVKEPAAITIPKEALSFGVINSVDNINSPEAAVGTILTGQQLNGNVAAAERAVDGIHRSIENSNSLESINIISDSVHRIDGSINWPYLDSIGKLNNLDGFIEIEEIRTVSPLGGSVLANIEGKTSTTLKGTAFVNFFVLKDRWSQERITVRKDYRISTTGSTTLLDILTDIQKKREYYRALGFELGKRAGRLIYPNWVWVNRMYYNKGSKELKRAKPMIQKGNWDIAEKQLNYGLDSRKKKALGRTYYNLALVNEGQGDIDQAIQHAETAALEYGDKMANEYLVILRQRKQQIELLND